MSLKPFASSVFSRTGTFLLFATTVVRDKLFANVVNADLAFNLGKSGIARRPSIVQSVPVFGPFNLRNKILRYIYSEINYHSTTIKTLQRKNVRFNVQRIENMFCFNKYSLLSYSCQFFIVNGSSYFGTMSFVRNM